MELCSILLNTMPPLVLISLASLALKFENSAISAPAAKALFPLPVIMIPLTLCSLLRRSISIPISWMSFMLSAFNLFSLSIVMS